jgi:hypothetical protein
MSNCIQVHATFSGMVLLELKLSRLLQFAPALLSGLFLVFPLSSSGTEQTTQQDQQPDILSSIDASRDYVSKQIIDFAREMDSFFGGNRNFQEANHSVVQLSLARTFGQLGDGRYVLAGRAKLDLPSTERRFHLMFETDPDKNVTGADTLGKQAAAAGTATGTATTAAPTTGTVTPSSYSAALRYEESRMKRDSHFSADAGVQFQGGALRPFGRMRGSYSVPLDSWRLKGSETLFWFHSTGTGETTQLDVEHVLSDPVLFRATTSATWLKRTLNFDLRQDLSFYQTVDARNALLYQASVIGVTRPGAQVTDSVLLVQYRHLLHRSWMYFELTPQLHFPRKRQYRMSTALFMSLEVNFDASR